MLRRRVLVLSALTLGAGAAVAVAGLVTAGGAQGAGTCSIYWTGATNTAWNTATNWSSSDGGPSAGVVPAATDFVCMSTAPTRSTVVAASANRTLSGIRFNATASVTPSLNLQGGVFTLNTNDSVINNLTATGTVTGSAPLTVTGTGALTSVALTGATKTIDTGAAYTSSGVITVGTASASTTLVDAGSLTLGGTTLQLLAATSGVTPNSLSVTGTLTLNNAASITTSGSTVVKPTVVSTGTVNAGGSGRKTIGPAFSSSGTVAVSTGTLALITGPVAAAPDTGTVSVAAGATFEYAGGTRTVAAGTLSGPGTVLASGGVTTFASGTTLPNLTLSGGTVSGSPSIGLLTATAGAFAGSGTATLTGSGSTICGLTLSTGFRLVNQGSTTYNSNCGYLQLATGGVFENAASFAITGGGAGYFITDDNNAADALINDAGATMTVTAGTANIAIRVATPFSNAGTVNIVTGKLQLNAGSSSAGPDTGTYSVPSGTQLIFAGGTRSIGAATLTGAGAFSVIGGTVTFASGVTLPNLTLDGGTVAGSPTIGTFTGKNGTLTGSGTTTVTGTSTLCQLTIAAGHRLLNQGTATYDTGCGYVEFASGGKLENAGSLTVTGAGTNGEFYDDDSNTANSVINDAGAAFTVNLSGPAAVLRIGIAFGNAGTVNVNVGRVVVNGGSVPGSPDTGTYNVASGTRLTFGAGTRTIGAATLAGAGTFEIAGANVVFSNGVTLPNLTFGGGRITGSPTIGVLTATGGIFYGPGTATVTGSGSTLAGIDLENGYQFVNQGTTTYQAGNTGYIYDGSQFENAGSLTITGTTGDAVYDDGTNGNAFLNDAGATVTVNLAAGANYLTLQTRFTNNGTVTAVRGALRLSTVTNLSSGGVLTGGTWTAAGGTISFPRTITSNAATTTLGATGALAVGSTTNPALAALASNSGALSIGQTLTGTASFSNTGTVAVTGGTWRVTTYTQTAGSTTVAAAGILKSGSTGTAAVAINGGVLAGAGAVQGAVAGVGTIQPGTAGSGTLTVTGSWSAAPATTLAVSAGATSTSLSVSGAAAINGTLAITTVQPTPAVGTSVTVVSAGSLTGTFSAVTGTDVPGSNATWVVGYASTSVTLTLTAYPQVSVSGGSVVEGNVGTASLPFTVTLSAVSAQPVTVAYATADGTASAATDYAANSNSLTFAPGTTTQTVSVVAVGDTVYEGDETVQLVLSAPSGATVGTGTASGTIVDDDAAPAVSVGSANATVGAGSGATLVFPVSLSAASGLDVTVDYATSDGTAVAPADYTATSGTLIIPAGSTTSSIAVAAPAQAGYAPPKTFTVTLSNPVRATLGTSSATGTISNSNPAGGTPTVASVSPSSAGQASSVPVVITGQNLPSNATVSVSGTGVTVTNVVVSTSARITATFTVASTATPGARDVTVNGTGGPATCTGCFTVTARPTVVAGGLSRTAFAAGNVDAQVDLTGSGYQPGTTFRIVKGARIIEATSVTVDSASALTAYLSIATNAVTGTYNVVVANPDGGTSTCTNCVTVYAAPKVVSVSPSTVARGTSTAMTFTGTGFVSGARLSMPGATFSNVVFVNSTTITATVTFSSTAATGSKTVKVFNPASAGAGVTATTGVVTVTT